jgi:hypothetical protein
MFAELINLCRKPIVLVCVDGREIILPPSYTPARVKSSRAQDILSIQANGERVDIEVLRSTTHGAFNVPDPKPGTYYIVPNAVANALPYRSDLLVTGLLSRDESGTITSARAVVLTTFDTTTSGAVHDR